MLDQQIFRNEDLVLKVSKNVDTSRFNPSAFDPFLDSLCSSREYQKEAIRTAVRYFLSQRYGNLRQLAEENYYANACLRDRFGSFSEMEEHLQLPHQLSCSLDLATATGKSYVMYGIARIMLAVGAVDRVLVLCPSTTIEEGLRRKFLELSAEARLRECLPNDSRVLNPRIVTGDETLVDGSICVENFHAVLPHVDSSIRASLVDKGERTLVLNDEVHHIFSPIGGEMKKWKEFLVDPSFRFRYVAGFSGTCYIGNEYFTDVIYRYSLRAAIEQGYAKTVEYVAEDTPSTQDEKFQKIYDNHRQNKVTYPRVKPLTILVTRDITACRRLAAQFVEFLSHQEEITVQEAEKKVLVVSSAPDHQANVRMLPEVDQAGNGIEWIVSVSMLTEGWDVENVFQIYPHEARAFNSKLLIAQVLGRGLRIPHEYRGERPRLIVFNHHAWSGSIKHLVDEILEIEHRVYSYPVSKSPIDYNFTLDHIDYAKAQETAEFEQQEEYEFTKGYITLVSQTPELARETTYVQALSGDRRTKSTIIRYQMYSVESVAAHINSKLMAIDTEEGTSYSQLYSLDWLKKLIRASLRRIGEPEDRVSAENRQRIQKAFGVVHRKTAQTVRYRMSPRTLLPVETATRHRDSTGVGAIRRSETYLFLDEDSMRLSDDDTKRVLRLLLEDDELPRAAINVVENVFLFKTPLNLVIADHKPERGFIRQLTKAENAEVLDAWIKAPDQDFYPIEFSWRKGEHPKRSSFNPDFFLKKGNHICVVEIKDDVELSDPQDENRGKYRAAKQHFEVLNSLQQERIYHFNFLTPTDFDAYFKFLRDGIYTFVSRLDAVLSESEGD